jgi:hypothetical protein
VVPGQLENPLSSQDFFKWKIKGDFRFQDFKILPDYHAKDDAALTK